VVAPCAASGGGGVVIAELMCGMCYRSHSSDAPLIVSAARCPEQPESRSHTGVGLYPCPDCGAMLLAGMSHPALCDEHQPEMVACVA